tara:strand:+ start:2533 stop:3039 length:507 start_codon:yes stop_codon:yes gene_type:complete
MVRTVGLKNYSDVHFTDRKVAKAIISYYNPKGSILEPFRGDSAFFEQLPGAPLWCEITEGRDFFDFTTSVDWIITNPPFSNLTDIMRHSFSIAEKTLFLIPTSKIYSSMPRMKLTKDMAGMKEHLFLGTGRDIGFDIGFPFSATLFERGYNGPTKNTWYDMLKGEICV